MPKKVPKEELEKRELRAHASIQKARELTLDHGTPSTRGEIVYLSTCFRRTLESLSPDLFSPPKTSYKKESAKEPLEEPGAGSSDDHTRVVLEPSPSELRTPRFEPEEPSCRSISFEEARKSGNPS